MQNYNARIAVQIVKDFLIAVAIALFLLTVVTVSPVLAQGGHYFVAVYDNKSAYYYYGVSGYQVTVSVSFQSGSAVASFVGLGQSNGDFFCCGFFQGTDVYGHYYANPTYYVDRVHTQQYSIWTYGQAPTGQNHQYYVYKPIYYGTMSALLDGTTLKTEGGYGTYASIASGQTESLNSLNQMNHHFWNVKGAQAEFRYYAFNNIGVTQNSPYYYTRGGSDAEWWARRS